MVDPTGFVRFVSDASRRIFGRVPETEIGQTVWDHVHPEDLVAAAGAVNEASRAEGHHNPTPIWFRHRDGRRVECEVNATTLDGPGGA